MPELDAFLAALHEGDATALHLRAGEPPRWRVGRELIANGDPLPAGSGFDAIVSEIFEAARLPGVPDGDACVAFDGPLGRYMARLTRTALESHLLVRNLPDSPPTGDRLLPPVETALSARSGIVLLAGGPGAGVSTTLARWVHELYRDFGRYVIHIDQPHLYRLSPGRGPVHQLEVGPDTPSISAGVRVALDAQADVIAVGRVEDAATARALLAAANGGALVLAGLRAGDATDGIRRFGALCDLDDPLARARYAAALRLAVYQVLLRGAAGDSVPAQEVLPIGSPARASIRENRIDERLSHGSDGQRLDQVVDELMAAGRLAAT